MRPALVVGPATADDADAIWDILRPIAREGATLPWPRDISRQAALARWQSAEGSHFLAREDRKVVGSYWLRRGLSGGGKHVASVELAVTEEAVARGIAVDLVEHLIMTARAQGFLALQHDFIAATDVSALELYLGWGFGIAGRLPRAFRHPVRGFVDALILHRFL